MAQIPIKYGRVTLRLDIPDQNLQHQTQLGNHARTPVNSRLLNQALTQLDPQLVRGRHVMVLCDDYTRPTPRATVFHALFPKLSTARKVDFLITTGTHKTEVPGNTEIFKLARREAEKAGIPGFEMSIHDVRTADFVDAGITSRGTHVSFNRQLTKPDVFIVISDCKPHYFAGYSNPLKHFLPGCCAFHTVEQNHGMALDKNAAFGRHPLHPNPDRRENPLAQDQLEGLRLIAGERPVYAMHLITLNGQILDAEFGEIFTTLPKFLPRVDEYFSQTVAPADIAIVSPGGFPDDESLYTAQRALELTAAGVKTGGRVLFLAACENGIGTVTSRKNFYQPLTRPLETVLKTIEDAYVLYAHKAYKFAVMIQDLSVLAVKSELDDNEISAIHMTPVHNIQKILDQWLARDPDATINVFHQANKLAVYAK